MAGGRITKRSVDALCCPSGKDRIFLWDESLSGFGVASYASGKRVYVVQYRIKGRSRRLSLGEHGRLTAEEARAAAKKLLHSVSSGSDPVEERKRARSEPDFRQIACEFMDVHATKLAQKTQRGYETLLRMHIIPALGSKRPGEIRRANVTDLHRAMRATPGAANRAALLISAIWNWHALNSENEELLARNPARKAKRYQEQGSERFLSTDELARLGEALAVAEEGGLFYEVDETKANSRNAAKPANRRHTVDPFAIAAIRMLIFTGCRLNEVMSAKWSYIDRQRCILNLPKSKTGRKPVFLSGAAMEVLAMIPRIEGNDFIIAGAIEGRARADLKRPWTAILKAAGIGSMRLHDLRHSFAAVGAGASLGLPIIGKLLGHSQPSTTQRYAHLANDPLQKAVNAIGTVLSGAMARQTNASSSDR